ncbi:ADP-ribose pyrophosphatase [Pseudomassariella vexata]|uniref:ADP-ribose pyrophosphatase n=1 Tax=Pseudomassariella vexata TaxID=1141098 RepID=A0A1Y2EHB2_9PEZI|nr:ADP-ribose pyrophosphatase [Pseudomassariella vexata]ORY70175.1 ADP-ribose pyrophosphatase [Pseudomassariella vexata]
MTSQPHSPQITAITDLPVSQAKWATLKKIDYVDQSGTSRSWEMAARKTRGKAGVDAVAIGNIILHPSRPPCTVLVIQYRPPLDAYTVEWPAGLIDADETPDQAAIRELKEETGYETAKVLDVSPTVAADPGLTNANMQLVMVEVHLKEGDAPPEQRLDDGENIERVVVPLADMYAKLIEYLKKERYVVAAKLWHWAAGLEFARTQKYI